MTVGNAEQAARLLAVIAVLTEIVNNIDDVGEAYPGERDRFMSDKTSAVAELSNLLAK